MRRVLFLIFSLLPLSSVRSADPTSAAPPDIIHTQWWSHSEHIYRRVDIYVPSACRASSGQRYPVL